MKTKPTQHSVKELRSIGIQPDILVCRCDRPLPLGLKQKLSEFCDVPEECVITSQDAKSIYEVPLMMEQEGLPTNYQFAPTRTSPARFAFRQTLVNRLYSPSHKIDIALVGKYVRLNDAYLSVVEALRDVAIAIGCDLNLHWINSEDLESGKIENYSQRCQRHCCTRRFWDSGSRRQNSCNSIRQKPQNSIFGIMFGDAMCSH